MKTFAQKKIQRKIARASRRGRYLVSRKGRRDRPGRKKGLRKCDICNNFLSEINDVGTTCKSCIDTAIIKKLMHIPKMTKK